MGARISAEMKRAQELLRGGLSAAEASRQSGISESAISKSETCQAIIVEYKTGGLAEESRRQSLALQDDPLEGETLEQIGRVADIRGWK